MGVLLEAWVMNRESGPRSFYTPNKPQSPDLRTLKHSIVGEYSCSDGLTRAVVGVDVVKF